MYSVGTSNIKKDARDFFGPSTWTTMHSCAVAYDPNEKGSAKAVLDFFHSFKYLLACKTCKKHYSKLIEEFPPDNYLENNESLFLYTYFLHDTVNERIGKTSPDFETIKNLYFKNLGAKCNSCNV